MLTVNDNVKEMTAMSNRCKLDIVSTLSTSRCRRCKLQRNIGNADNVKSI